MTPNSKEAEESNSKILSGLMLIILFVSMGQSVYWQTMPIIGREFNFSEIEINTLVSILAKKAGAKNCYALLNEDKYKPVIPYLDIDGIISPRELTVSRVLRYIRKGKVSNVDPNRKINDFDLIPKKVTINKLNLISWSQKKGELLVDVDCSTGTYIRSLARDIGDKIGCGGYLKSLRRTKAYNFIENHSVKLPEKSDFYPEEDKPKVLNPNIFFKHLSSFELISEEEIISWRSGRKISFQNNVKRLKVSKNNEVEDNFIHNNNILVLNKENKILGIACLDESFAIKPKVVFNAIG